MASPPFSLSTSTPGDSDIVSQFPLNERTLRDIISSWILANHDTNGNHTKVIMPFGSLPTTPSASLITVYADSVGRLKIVFPDASVGFVGVPPGTVFYGAFASIPVGYLVADGSAVSRSTYADLFGAISTTFGPGNGSTTFNVPNGNGRVFAGEDNAAGVLTSTYLGTSAVLGASGGSDHTTLLLTHLPPITPTGTITNGAITVNIDRQVYVGGSGSGVGGGGSFGILQTPIFPASQAASTFNGAVGGGSSTPFTRVPPTLVLKAIIKT